MKKTLGRFRKPLSDFNRDNMDVVIGSTKRCLNTVDGEIFLKHLIDFYNLDEPRGCIDSRDSAYLDGQQDVVKAILSLTNDT